MADQHWKDGKPDPGQRGGGDPYWVDGRPMSEAGTDAVVSSSITGSGGMAVGGAATLAAVRISSTTRVTDLVAEYLADAPAAVSTTRVTALVAEYLSDKPVTSETRVTALILEYLYSEMEAELIFSDGNVSHPLSWLELTDKAGTLKTFAEVDLNDPAPYYGGYKFPWVVQWNKVARGMGDRMGQMEHLSFGLTLTDTVRYFRALLAGVTTRFLMNRPLVQRMIDDEDRRAQRTPRLVASGFVSEYSPLPDYQFAISGTDWLKAKYTRSRRAQNAWQPLITPPDFPDCPQATLNTPAPVPYGSIGLSGAANITGLTLTIPATGIDAPTGLSATPSSGGFGFPDEPAYYKISAVVGGIEGERADTAATPTGSNLTISLSWDAYGGEDEFLLYRSSRPDFLQYDIIRLAAATTSFDDQWIGNKTANGSIPLIGGGSLLGDNGNPLVQGLRQTITYWVMAKLPDGSYSLPVDVTANIIPAGPNGLMPRIDPSWTLYPDAHDGILVVRHRVYYGNWGPQYDYFWNLASGSTSLSDTTYGANIAVGYESLAPLGGAAVAPSQTGQVRAIYAGTRVITIDAVPTRCGRFVVSRGACKRLGRVDVNKAVSGADDPIAGAATFERVPAEQFGVVWFHPFEAGWPFADPFVTINGNRWMEIYTTLNPVPETVLVDVDGYETVGDGTGDLITCPALQALHFTDNFLAAPTIPAGNWVTDSTATRFAAIPSLTLVDRNSFTAAHTALLARISGGYEGAGILGSNGDVVGAEDALARFCVSGDFDVTWNRKSQLGISVEPFEAPAEPILLTDIINIIDKSFSITDNGATEFFNIIPYVHTKDYTGRNQSGWASITQGDVEIRDDGSIANHEQEIPAPTFEFWFLRSTTPQGAATIADVKRRKIARFSTPRRRVKLGVSLSGTSVELGDVIEIDAQEGVGAEGWAGRRVRAIRHELDSNINRVDLELYDLDIVWENLGIVITPPAPVPPVIIDVA